MVKNVFITGITGLLGANLAEDLLSQGFNVKALVRNSSKRKLFVHPKLTYVEGTLETDISMHLKEAEVFIHIAAEARQALTAYKPYYKTNVLATHKLYQTCNNAGVKQFILISSANTMGYGTMENPGHEAKPISALFSRSFYARSKWEAEQLLLAQTGSTKVVVLNPTFMIGAYDRKPSSGKIILMAWKKKLVFYPPGGKNFVAAKEVSQAVIKSMEKGKNKERYLISNENLSYRAFFRRLNTVAGQSPLMIPIPRFILIGIGYAGDFLRALGINTSISSTNMKILCINNWYANQKSIGELGMRYAPVEHALMDAVGYFEKQRNRE
ncbi:MAG: NAD-dependent epimerase/dehydratase family protein [Phaeodactylibacter sp.]|nr:NAD-dependent epimerase/dehydratase family protein [Phaeodactylibacter sp.]